ncbi:class I SAM-dependent methyltransferase [soil metagenome]
MTSRWQDLADDDSVADYDARSQLRLAEVRAAGTSEHAEADLVAQLRPGGGSVLDAGCGTGRVSRRLAHLGYAVTGVDSDPRMLAIARDHDGGPPDQVTYVKADLTAYQGDLVDVVLAAGNVIPLLAPGTLELALRSLSAHLRPGGLLVCGYGLDTDHLPSGCPTTSIEQVEAAATTTALTLLTRWGTWVGGPFTGEYAVEVRAAQPRSAHAD